MKKVVILLFIFSGLLFASNFFYMQGKEKIVLHKIKSTSNTNEIQKNSLNAINSNSSIDYYTLNSGAKIGVNNTLIVRFKNFKNLKKYENTYHITFIKDLSLNMYVFSCVDKSKTLGIANALNKKSDVIFAQPNFIQTLKLQ